VKTDNT
jgi:hypothetical protein